MLYILTSSEKAKKKNIPNSWSPTTRMYFLSCLQFADEKEKKRKNQKQQQRKKNRLESNTQHRTIIQMGVYIVVGR